ILPSDPATTPGQENCSGADTKQFADNRPLVPQRNAQIFRTPNPPHRFECAPSQSVNSVGYYPAPPTENDRARVRIQFRKNIRSFQSRAKFARVPATSN